ncbi:MAG: FAD:protein FMN transferase [Sulfurimonas sp.]|nr:FAD:protein FMN transferase [Sulfurimonas sp.]
MFFYNFEAFTSPCELQIEIADKTLSDSVAHAIYTNAKRLENEYGFFKRSSQLTLLNNRTQNRQIVSDELAGLIHLSLFYSDKTEGTFDIAVAGTLKEASFASTLQEYNKKIDKLLPFASSTHLKINENEVIFSNNFTKIDLGGLVKEYAVDASIRMLKNAGVSSALVNFGGDVAAYGTYNSSLWCVGVQNPDMNEQNLCEVTLNENALCTSGHSKRFYQIETERKSHIISAKPKYYSQISM